MITHGDMTVEGVSLVGDYYTVKNGELIRAEKVGYVQDGSILEASAGVYIDGPLILYLIKTVNVLSSSPCNLSGSVVPVGMTVHLSVVQSGDTSPESLANSVFADVVSSADDGSWTAAAPDSYGGFVAAWIRLPVSSLSEAADASLTISTDQEAPDVPVDPPSIGANQISQSFSATPEILNDATNFSFQADLSGPSDLTGISIYAIDPDTAEIDSQPLDVYANGSDGQWSLSGQWERSGTPYDQFEVRGYTDDPDGQMEITVTRYEASCLSGDTLITLADGSAKRLDELTRNDLVMGGDMRPARIIRLARGHWNDHHILYHFDDGTTIDEVHEHRFYDIDQGFWQKLMNWRIGDRARRQDGGETALVSVERVNERKEMFGLWVERSGYWANDLLSGDACANLPLLQTATAEQAVEMAASLPEREITRLIGKEIAT